MASVFHGITPWIPQMKKPSSTPKFAMPTSVSASSSLSSLPAKSVTIGERRKVSERSGLEEHRVFLHHL